MTEPRLQDPVLSSSLVSIPKASAVTRATVRLGKCSGSGETQQPRPGVGEKPDYIGPCIALGFSIK